MENGKCTQFLIDLAYRLSLSMDFLRCSLAAVVGFLLTWYAHSARSRLYKI